MRTFKDAAMRVAGSIALVLVSIATPTSGAEPAKEVAAILAVDEVFVKAYNADDVDTVVSLYAEQAVLLPPGAPRAAGTSAIRAFFVVDMAESAKAGAKFVLGANPDGGVSGDLGWASGTYAVTDKAGQVIERGKYLSVSRKIDGKWRYIRDTWNADGAPALATPAADQKK